MIPTFPPLVLGALLAAPPAKEAPVAADYLQRHAVTRGFTLGRPVQPKVTPDNRAVLFLRAEPRSPKMSLFEFDVASQKTRRLLAPADLLGGGEENISPEEKARRERMRVSAAGFTSYQLSEDGKSVLLSLSGRLWLLDRGTGKARELKTGRGPLLDPKFSPDGRSVAYVRDHDVHVYDLGTDRERRVTTGGTAKKTHGLAEFVAQEEMHRYSGYWWSPDAKSIVYEEADHDGVEVWSICDPSQPGLPPAPQYYPRPGKANVKVRVGIVPVSGGDTKWVEWDAKKYEYLTQVRWDKDGPPTITVQTRRQDELTLLKVDPATGKTTPLVTERDPAWVQLHQEVPKWLPGGGSFLWVGAGENGPELQWRDADGHLDAVLVPARVGFAALVSVNLTGKQVVYQAGTDPTQAHLFLHRLGVEPKTPGSDLDERLTTAPGQNSAVFSKDHSLRVVTTTTPGQMPRTTVLRGDGTVIGELASVAEEPGFTPRVTIAKVGPGEGFYTAVVLPHDFDPAKKYPVIVDVYGGPGHVHVVAAERNWLLDQWLADQGFIVAAVDNRGTPGRGREWEKAISKQFGSVPLEDQVAGLRALAAAHPQMDLGRVGIVGWSFGGYMSALAVLKRPDVYKAAVAGAPVCDWEDYDTHYTERYLGLLPADESAYRESSLLTYANELKRPLLVVHGTADDNVYFRHSLRLVDALFRHGQRFDMLPLAGQTHMVTDPAVTEHLWQRIAGHFKTHLK